eukprot:TRINITY_DN13053_c0_g1_i4.p2 TRINITY_DN13053_c0_g1~~TRINITY_DN13053_c0_g1_i4.p2  ORF type:complete len:342 (+),score=68.12 TRINITY_DN13053_c0_g1_i4:45-1070(+)
MSICCYKCSDQILFFFFFSSRRRHTRFLPVSWARRCVQETVSTQSTWETKKMGLGIYLPTPNKIKDTVAESSSKLKFAASSMQGWRNTMEDAHITALNFDINTSLFAVFDGHGGKEVSELCAQEFGELLKRNDNYQKNLFKLALKEVFEELDDIMEEQDKDSYYTQGCTANVILIRDNQLFLANSGDSRSLLSLKNGDVEQLSIDHKPELESERTRIINAGGFVMNGRINGNLNLSRALGDLEYKKSKEKSKAEQIISCVPEIIERTIDETFNYILMGCDGIFEMLSNESLFEYIYNQMRSTEDNLALTVENLLEQIIAPNTQQGIGCDNMSAILLKFDYQ